MRAYFLRPFQVLYLYRSMIMQITKREIILPYAGQVFGGVWPIVHPLALMLLYAVVFSFILAPAFGGTEDMPFNYTVFLLSGLIPWVAFQTVLGRASLEVTGNANLVKQVIFPLEILPVKGVLASLIAPAISLIFLMIYTFLSSHELPWTYVLLPIAVLLGIIWMLGIAFFLAALGVYFRDAKDFINIFVLASIYLLPIIYIPGAVPPVLRPLVDINPFSSMILCFRDTLYFGHIDHPLSWIVYAVCSVVSFYVGYYFFQKLRPFFGNVL